MAKKINKIIISVIFLFEFLACNKQPYKPDYSNVKGFVIGKEVCNSNETLDYWLIDLTYSANTPEYGDTLFYYGANYTNVVKTKDLDSVLKVVGKRVSLDFKTITNNKVQTTGCNVPIPETYDLKEIFIINQGEIR